jgi:hypothetical protein
LLTGSLSRPWVATSIPRIEDYLESRIPGIEDFSV